MKKTIYPIISGLLLVISVFSVSCKKKKEDPEPNTPLGVTTSQAKSITGTSVVLSGTVTGNGGETILERGFCGDIAPKPVLQNSNKIVATGTEVGDFSKHYNTLNPNLTYYVRSYVRTSNDTVYGSQISFTTTDLQLGDYYEGGYICYLDGTGQHGIVAAESDITTLSGFGCIYTSGGVVSTSAAIGTGQANTTGFMNYCINVFLFNPAGTAIGECDSYTSNGYSDWYLPSYDELNLIYTNLKLEKITKFRKTYYYCSTAHTGNPGNIMYALDFVTGTQQTIAQTSGSGTYQARAVRTF